MDELHSLNRPSISDCFVKQPVFSGDRKLLGWTRDLAINGMAHFSFFMKYCVLYCPVTWGGGG